MSRPIGTPLELERRRRHAVELLRHGESPTQVAHFLGVDRSSLYRWRQRAEHGPQALAAQPHPHRPPLLSPAQVAQLETLLAQGAAAHGWPNALWTTQRVADLIHRHFAIRYHHDHVGRFLRQRLGWTPQKPRRVARERDEAAILDWQAEQFPQIADAAQQRGAHLDQGTFRVSSDDHDRAATTARRRAGAASPQPHLPTALAAQPAGGDNGTMPRTARASIG